MLWFFFCVALLLAGYFFYSRVIERIFVINPNRQTPAYTMNDGVDYMPMSKTKIWLIQLLNIAGTGPIFGPILGALYGPVAMLWIVVGCIFAGAVHDYFCGMLSVRNGGASMPNLAGKYLGRPVKAFINILAVVLLLLVGVVFVASPAQLMGTITMDVFGAASGSISISNAEEIHQVAESGGITVWGMDKATVISVWTAIIFIYYILATLLPVDKIIGRIYPFFGALLLFMSVGMVYGLVTADLNSADPISFYRSVDGMSFEKFFQNFETRADLPLWPLLFLTISCGALSGFHATQSPLMARCTENEKEARFIFYGAMIGEGVIALVWCAVGFLHFHPLPPPPSKSSYTTHFFPKQNPVFQIPPPLSNRPSALPSVPAHPGAFPPSSVPILPGNRKTAERHGTSSDLSNSRRVLRLSESPNLPVLLLFL